MKKYYRVMLGRKSVHADACVAGGFIGTDFDLQISATTCRSIGTVSNLTPHALELEKLIGGATAPRLVSTDATRIRRALKMVPNIQFYRYQVTFKLVKA